MLDMKRNKNKSKSMAKIRKENTEVKSASMVEGGC